MVILEAGGSSLLASEAPSCGEIISVPTLSSKTNEEPAVVALPLVVHEDTIELNWARGPMVHLFRVNLKYS